MHEKNVALVLGGGGAAGHAWLIGVVAGLAEGGFDLTELADLVIGTSAGATAAAHVRSGIPIADLFASILAEPVRPAAPGGARPPSSPMGQMFERMRSIGAAANSALDLQRAMGAYGLECDSLLEPGAKARRALVASRLPRPEWPERPMVVTALEALTGELVAFHRDSGVELVDAIAASTAMPGAAPTVEICRVRYIDGGVRSTENADLATGYAKVVVLSPLGGRTPTEPGQFEGLRRDPEWRTDLPSQLEDLRKQGSQVLLITPDPDSRSAMGPNLMDISARIPTAKAAFIQGKRQAADLNFR